ncbi:MAG TPA: hypothetical protein VFN51_03805 [Candidatus Saccharimonadales bacterium]|nr:hypothetical protein [Candidatus Saccharimonadales bacterium]
MLNETAGWKSIYRSLNRQSAPTGDLHELFLKHSQYLSLSMEKQRFLITDVHAANHSFIISEISVLESQKQTIERMVATYTNDCFAFQSELATFKANILTFTGIIVAMAAVIISHVKL